MVLGRSADWAKPELAEPTGINNAANTIQNKLHRGDDAIRRLPTEESVVDCGKLG